MQSPPAQSLGRGTQPHKDVHGSVVATDADALLLLYAHHDMASAEHNFSGALATWKSTL